MKRWEYRTEIWQTWPLEGLLNIVGHDGWELVAVSAGKVSVAAFFKRAVMVKVAKRKRRIVYGKT